MNVTPQKRLGAEGENRALEFLLQKGLEFIDQNVHAPGGELDLVMQDGEDWVFVEVKTRRSHSHGTAIESVTPQKIKRMLKAIEHYFLVRKEANDIPPFRIDIVTVEKQGREWRCDHYSHIAAPGE